MSDYQKALAHYRIAIFNDPAVAERVDGALVAANSMPALPPAHGLSAEEAAAAMRAYIRDLRRWRDRDAERRSIQKSNPKP